MTKQEFVNWAIGKGWSLDRWGHLSNAVLTEHTGTRLFRLIGGLASVPWLFAIGALLMFAWLR